LHTETSARHIPTFITFCSWPFGRCERLPGLQGWKLRTAVQKSATVAAGWSCCGRR